MNTARDPRIAIPTHLISTNELIDIFSDHARGIPAATVCPRCGHRFAANDTTGDCPTNAVVRPLLYRHGLGNFMSDERLTPQLISELGRSATSTTPAPTVTMTVRRRGGL